jgi:hypothetical protein
VNTNFEYSWLDTILGDNFKVTACKNYFFSGRERGKLLIERWKDFFVCKLWKDFFKLEREREQKGYMGIFLFLAKYDHFIHTQKSMGRLYPHTKING